MEDRYITEYRVLLDQALNLANLYRGGKFEMTDSFDKQNEFLTEIEFFKSQGRLN